MVLRTSFQINAIDFASSLQEYLPMAINGMSNLMTEESSSKVCCSIIGRAVINIPEECLKSSSGTVAVLKIIQTMNRIAGFNSDKKAYLFEHDEYVCSMISNIVIKLVESLEPLTCSKQCPTHSKYCFRTLELSDANT